MVIRLGGKEKRVADIMTLGVNNTKGIDKLCAFLLAVSPILQHYRGIYDNAGFTVLLIVMPVLLLRFLTKRKVAKRTLLPLLPLLVFELYSAVVHSSNIPRLLYVLFMMVVFTTLASGCVNTGYFLKYATGVVSVATGLLVIQYISHYIFHHTINMRPFSLLVSQDVIWVRHLNTLSGTGRLYRPAAFFLEPSHFFLYAFPVLCILLLSPNMTPHRKKLAVWISMGMLMTTSGFGIFVSVGLWGVYLLFYSGEERRKRVIARIFSGRTLLLLVAFILLLVLAYIFIPIFRRSVERIFFVTEGSTAIDGRIRLASNYISTITGRAVWFGQANVTSNLEFNLAGFFATYIKWGIIGVVLTYWFYGQGLWKLKRCYFWLSAIIIVISFFTAHTHGTFYMLYFMMYLMNGYYDKTVHSSARKEALVRPHVQKI